MGAILLPQCDRVKEMVAFPMATLLVLQLFQKKQ